MTNDDSKFVGSIPKIYDTYLVPLIFQTYASDLAERIMANHPGKILETAAGSGVVSCALAPRLGPDTSYVVTDLNQAMIDHAEKQLPADALELPFEDNSFDVVACQFGVMFFPDKARGYSEARKVLKDGGKFVFNVWDSLKTNEFADEVTKAAGKIFPDDPPLFMARTPHGYHDEDIIRNELMQVGFSNVTFETIQETSTAPSSRDVAIAFCQGTPLRNEIETRDASLLPHVTDAAERAIANRFGSGAVLAKIQGIVVEAS